MLVCGDFYQLPPVRRRPTYANASSMKGYINLDLWRNFKLVELTEIMRQKGDGSFISTAQKMKFSIKDFFQ